MSTVGADTALCEPLFRYLRIGALHFEVQSWDDTKKDVKLWRRHVTEDVVKAADEWEWRDAGAATEVADTGLDSGG